MFKAFFKLGGRRWIRTIEAKRNRFTVCPLWPLGNSPLSSFSKIKAYCLNSRLQWSWWTDLNPRPADYKSAALPTELHQRIQLSLLHSLFNFECLYNISHSSSFVNTFFKLFLIFLKHFHFLKMSSNESARLLYHPQSYSSRVFAKKFFIVFFDKISYEFFVAPLLNCKPFGLQLN